MKVLLAVSGGIDSMYMLHRAPELFPGASFAVAHCNFRLRGEESDGDEAFVAAQCASLGVECFVKRFDTLEYASGHGVSVEMAARELRYAWFSELCSEHGFDALVTAHNANDNAETMVLNLLRGTGTKGLRGIPDRADLLRPLLGVTREEIRVWMEEKGFAWREDSTNAESEVKRNKIRNRVFPVFAEINPSFVKTLGEDMARIRQTDDIAEDYYQEAAARIEKRAPEASGDAILEISVKGLLELKHWRYVLWRALEDYGFSAETFGKLCDLLDRYINEPSGTVTLSGKTFQSPTHYIKARKKSLCLFLRSQDK
jgi:tRNA(Ile)-lysidine synthase